MVHVFGHEGTIYGKRVQLRREGNRPTGRVVLSQTELAPPHPLPLAFDILPTLAVLFGVDKIPEALLLPPG